MSWGEKRVVFQTTFHGSWSTCQEHSYPRIKSNYDEFPIRYDYGHNGRTVNCHRAMSFASPEIAMEDTPIGQRIELPGVVPIIGKLPFRAAYEVLKNEGFETLIIK